jgi:type I restriction enzyme S subunit
MKWEKKPLGEIINLKRGYDLPSQKRKHGLVPIISSSGITDFHSEPVKSGEGVVTGRYGTLGQLFYVNGDYWPLNTTLYVQDFKSNVPRFIYYFLKTLNLEKYNGASAVPGLDRNVIHKVDVSYISHLPTQRKIASILSAYDDLIENNLKRIKLLEEKAFVSYKLLMSSEKLIEGKLGDLADVKSGYAFKGSDWTDEGFPVIKIKNIGNNDINLMDCSLIPENIAEAAAKFKLNAGDLLIAMTGATVGKIGMMPKTETAFYLNQRVGIFKPKVENAELFLFCFYNEPSAKDAVESLASGAAQPNISGGQLESIKLFYPKLKTVTEFGSSIKSHFELIWNLKQQNTKLREARDILLPKLMNGQIVV